MSADLFTRAATGSHVYAVLRNASAAVWNGTSFVAFADASYATYAVALTEQASSGFFNGSFPVAITTGGRYVVEFFKRAGSTPAESDAFISGGIFDWNGSAVVDDEQSPTSLTSLAYVKLFNGITGSENDAFLLARIAAASAAVENYCHRKFSLDSYTETLDGPASFQLLLSHYPVASVTSVAVEGYAGGSDVIDGYDIQTDAGSGIIRVNKRSSACPYFPGGFGNITATYTAGFASVPYDVQDIIAQIVGNQLQQRGRDQSISMEKTLTYQVSFRAEAYKRITPEMRETLDFYKQSVV